MITYVNYWPNCGYLITPPLMSPSVAVQTHNPEIYCLSNPNSK
jgi:hypothetical protein